MLARHTAVNHSALKGSAASNPAELLIETGGLRDGVAYEGVVEDFWLALLLLRLCTAIAGDEALGAKEVVLYFLCYCNNETPFRR